MIAFFGGSVTQQSNGYVDFFRRLSGQKVKKFGYGGMHLSNAGICFLDDVCRIRPSLCYVDWFSTAFNETSDAAIEYVNTIVCKLAAANCRVVFLFFPYRGDPKKGHFYDFLKRYFARNGLEFLSVDEALDIDRDPGLLRDEIHTTPHGSRIYAEQIFQHYKATHSVPHGKAVDGSTRALDGRGDSGPVKTARYADIKTLDINAEFRTRVLLEGKCHIIGILMIVGKHSGIIEALNGDAPIQFNTWDKWCHFPRDHFYIDLPVSGACELLISQAPFDTSSCKESVDFSSIDKRLIIKKIFYTGDHLRISNADEGRPISRGRIWLDRVQGRINQKLRQLSIRAHR